MALLGLGPLVQNSYKGAEKLEGIWGGFRNFLSGGIPPRAWESRSPGVGLSKIGQWVVSQETGTGRLHDPRGSNGLGAKPSLVTIRDQKDLRGLRNRLAIGKDSCHIRVTVQFRIGSSGD